MLTYSQRGTFAKRGAAMIEADITAAVAAEKARADAEWAQARAEYAKRNAPVPFTAEQLKAAKVVRTDVGWHKVVKVNAKSVTVETGYSWTDRHALEKILEVR